jgi:hypothetical protein
MTRRLYKFKTRYSQPYWILALRYYQALRAAGVVSRLQSYPRGDHAADRPFSEADFWINVALWLGTHLRLDHSR